MWIVENNPAQPVESRNWFKNVRFENGAFLTMQSGGAAAFEVSGNRVSENAFVLDGKVPEALFPKNVARVIKAPSFDLQLPMRRSMLGPGAASMSTPEDSWAADFWDVRGLRENGLTGRSIRIGIADSGIDLSHPAFAPCARAGKIKAFARFDSVGGIVTEVIDHPDALYALDASQTVSDYHGTHCAGIMCAAAVNGKGEGIAPGADLYIANVLDEKSRGEVAQIYAGISWLKKFKCDIVSLSLGWWGFRDHWAGPLADLLSAGTVVVAASGNEYEKFKLSGKYAPTRSPGNYPFDNDGGNYPGFFLSVGAIDKSAAIAKFSGGAIQPWPATYSDATTDEAERPTYFAGYPTKVVPTLVAPGVSICAPVPLGEYDIVDGTSQATPAVAGLIALVLESLRKKKPEATGREAAQIVISSLSDAGAAGPDDRYGLGLPGISKIFGL